MGCNAERNLVPKEGPTCSYKNQAPDTMILRHRGTPDEQAHLVYWLQASLAGMIDASAVEQGVQLCRDKAAEQDGLAVVPCLPPQAPLPHPHDVHVPLHLRQAVHGIEHCRRQVLRSGRQSTADSQYGLQRCAETGPKALLVHLHDVR